MSQRDVLIATPDGTCDASLHTPSGAGPWPAVIIYPDAGGTRPTTVFTDPERARLGDLVASVTEEAAARDTEAMLDFLADQPEVAGTKVGTTGYCMGGSFALTAAGRFPDLVAAAASIHGGQIASTAPDSPHLLAPSRQAKVYPRHMASPFPTTTYDVKAAARHWQALEDLDASTLASNS